MRPDRDMRQWSRRLQKPRSPFSESTIPLGAWGFHRRVIVQKAKLAGNVGHALGGRLYARLMNRGDAGGAWRVEIPVVCAEACQNLNAPTLPNQVRIGAARNVPRRTKGCNTLFPHS